MVTYSGYCLYDVFDVLMVVCFWLCSVGIWDVYVLICGWQRSGFVLFSCFLFRFIGWSDCLVLFCLLFSFEFGGVDYGCVSRICVLHVKFGFALVFGFMF